MKLNHFIALAFIGSSLVATAGDAAAQTTEERAGARALADQGYDAFKAGQWTNAADLFERAEELVHSPVHVLFLARSQAKLGLLLEAKEGYLQVLREPRTPATRQLRREAERELEELEPTIPSVTLEVAGVSPGETFEVTQDGRALPMALVGVARPVNPGDHTWTVSAAGRAKVAETRAIEAGTRSRLVLALAPKSEPDVDLTASGAGSIEMTADGVPGDTAPRAKPGLSPLVYVGFGVAAVGTGVGVGFLLEQKSIEDEVRRTCLPAGCVASSANLQRKEDADRAGLISAIGFVAGGVGLATAVTLWVLDETAESETAAHVRPYVGVGSFGVSGRF